MHDADQDELRKLLHEEQRLVEDLRHQLATGERSGVLLQLLAIVLGAFGSAIAVTWFVSDTFVTKAELKDSTTELRDEIQTTAPFLYREKEIDSKFESVETRLTTVEGQIDKVLHVVTENKTNIAFLLSHQTAARDEE